MLIQENINKENYKQVTHDEFWDFVYSQKHKHHIAEKIKDDKGYFGFFYKNQDDENPIAFRYKSWGERDEHKCFIQS